MLDNISRQILISLAEDGRLSYTQIAKRLNVKLSTVTKRVRNLLDKDVIVIQAVPNLQKIGYKVMVVIAMDVELSKVRSACDKLVNNPNISSIVTAFGRFDVILFAEFYNFDGLNRLVQEEIPRIEGINRMDTFFISDIKKTYGDIFSRDSIGKPADIDEIDRNLINELRIDGRANYTVLAAKYGTSSATISRRVAALIKKNIIRITTVPNPPRLLGYSAVTYLGIQAELGKINEICEELSNYPEVYSIYTLMSGFSILAVVVLPNLEDLYRFIIEKISKIDGVANVETLIRAELRKRTYLAFNLRDVITQIKN
jgi:Lrp/AsnC family transcriptional regulator, regulator for asnA, asnC and gidA